LKSLRLILLLIIALCLLLGVCGCMSNVEQNCAEEMQRLALDYLNNLYDDEFMPRSYSSSDWAYNYESVIFSSKKYDDSVVVRIYEDNGNYVFKDNYYELSMKAEAEQFFKDIAKNNGCMLETKVRFISLGSDDINAADPFSKYVEQGNCHLEVYFIANQSFGDAIINSILNDVCKAKVKGNMRFLVTDDSELLDEFSISEIVNEKSESVLEKKSYTINSSFQVVE